MPAAGTILHGSGPVTITLTATDKGGNSAACSFTLTAQDLLAPVISAASVNPPVLDVPNHKMRMITVSYTATDNCGPVTSSLSVASNEPVDGEADWEIIDEHKLRLRAERLGTGTGRIYTITITATDAAGNSTTQDVTVAVPHDNGNIIVQTNAREKQTTAMTPNGLVANVIANPSAGRFTLVTQSNSAQAVQMKVVDNTGRLVESRQGIPANGITYVGSGFRPGIYFIELTQAGKKQTLKLVKTSK